MTRPILIIVQGIGDINGVLKHDLYAENADTDSDQEVRIEEALRALLVAGHLHAYNATAAEWQGIGHATGGKVMVDAGE